MQISEWIEYADKLVWGPWLLVLLLGTGCYLMIKLKFLPIKNLGKALKSALGRDAASGKEKRGKGKVSSFSSLTTELAATIGTGNIVGVTTAMVLGGPGALVWMMLSAIIGMATKLVESTLAVKYRSINDRGEAVGGPMYTMVRGICNKKAGRILAYSFAVFAVLASFGMGNMTQSNSIALAIKNTFDIPETKTGLVLTIITILVVLGGINSIAKITNIVVPVMGIFYMAGTFCVILMHINRVPKSILCMFTAAFTPGAACGGIAGQLTADMFSALRYGVSRGVFSNEAGLGAAGISAACADTDDYIKQGYISMTGVFLDTIVICSATGLALMCSGVLGKTGENGEVLTGIELTISVFETVFGRFGSYFVSICIALFAFATILGWAYQGEKAFEFLVKRSKYCVYYRFVYGLVVFVGTVCTLDVVWNFSDICNGLMAVPNLICVLILSRKMCMELADYKFK